MSRVAIITSIPAPYRIDFFSYLQQTYNGSHEFYIIFSSESKNRSWDVDFSKLKNYKVLDSKMFRVKKELDDKIFIISVGLKKVLKKIKPDVVVAMEYNPTALQALLWSKANKIPYITWTDGTLNSEKYIGHVGRFLRRIVIRSADAFISSSTKSKELQIAYGADPKRVFLSLLSFDIRSALIKEDVCKKDGHIIFVGSLIKRKGLDLLINALRDVKQDYILHVVGEGIEKENYKELCIKNNISDKVVFHGFLSAESVYDLYKECSFFVLPSREDCYGLVVLEAMCGALPILVSKYVDSSYDLVEDGVNGYIFSPEDTGVLTQKIQLLLTNKELRDKMGRESLKKALECSFVSSGKEFIRAIESVER